MNIFRKMKLLLWMKHLILAWKTILWTIYMNEISVLCSYLITWKTLPSTIPPAKGFKGNRENTVDDIFQSSIKLCKHRTVNTFKLYGTFINFWLIKIMSNTLKICDVEICYECRNITSWNSLNPIIWHSVCSEPGFILVWSATNRHFSA